MDLFVNGFCHLPPMVLVNIDQYNLISYYYYYFHAMLCTMIANM